MKIELNNQWREYTKKLPPGAKGVGVVSRGNFKGALVLLESGVYAQVNDTTVQKLDQRVVKRLLGIKDENKGRPKKETVRVVLSLDPELFEKAQRLGDGKATAGIIRAISIA